MKTIAYVAVAMVAGLLFGLGVTQLELAGGEHFRLENRTIDDVGGAQVAVASSGTPRAVVDNPTFDVGVIEEFSTGTHAFKIRNEGDAPLKLTLQGTTCKCTVGKLETDVIPPGEVGVVKLEYKAEALTMEYRHGANIGTNDPENSQITLTVEGVVEKRLFVRPESVVFTRISANEPSVARTGIFVRQIPGFAVKETRFLEPIYAQLFEVELAPAPPEMLAAHRRADNGLKVTIRIKPGLPNGPFNQTLRVFTENTVKEFIDIPIQGSVIADVSLVGGARFRQEHALYDLGVVDAKKGHASQLLVLVKGANREKIKVKVGEVKPKSCLRAELGEPVIGAKVVSYPLKLIIPPGSPPANYLGTLASGFGHVILETDDPRNKRIRTRIRFAVE